MPTYMTSLGRFLPGAPIPTGDVEAYIGAVGADEAVRDHVLSTSGIRTRHYVIDHEQQTRYSSVDLCEHAIRAAIEPRGIDVDDIGLLTVATSGGDLIGPSLASMVHGRLESPPCEVASINGLCCAGMIALKSSWLQLEAAQHDRAVVCASEITSRLFKSSRYGNVERDENGRLAFDMAFLRYLLSDGAGAAVLERAPAPEGLSLRVEWITVTSYANTTQPCMYVGSPTAQADRSWLDYPTFAEAEADGALALRQNMRLLPRLIKTAADECQRLMQVGMVRPDEISHIAVHYSTEALKPRAQREFARRGLDIGSDLWYSNLPEVGNIGCAAIFVILDGLMRTGRLQPGEKILCFVPESGRFTVSFALLTVVGPDDEGA
jgi:3-oxoacyl-[acyl-carrier-protein] synthase-3